MMDKTLLNWTAVLKGQSMKMGKWGRTTVNAWKLRMYA